MEITKQELKRHSRALASVIAFDGNHPNAPINRQRLASGLNSGARLHAIYKKFTLNIMTEAGGKQKDGKSRIMKTLVKGKCEWIF